MDGFAKTIRRHAGGRLPGRPGIVDGTQRRDDDDDEGKGNIRDDEKFKVQAIFCAICLLLLSDGT